MNTELHFSSATDNWPTPDDVVDLVRESYPIELDVCASAENAKCPRYFTAEQNGLAQEWRGVCWMNPPYGRAEHVCKPLCKKKICAKRGHHCTTYKAGVDEWVRKAHDSARDNGATVVCLLPARTDTRWWHTYCEPVLRGELPGEVVFWEGRIAFGDAESGAPFPSVLVVFKPQAQALEHKPECRRCDGGDCGYPCSRCGAEYGGACDVPDCSGRRRCECKDPGLNCVRDCPVRLAQASEPHASECVVVREALVHAANAEGEGGDPTSAEEFLRLSNTVCVKGCTARAA